MPSTDRAPDAVLIALLHQSAESSAHLQQALEGFGATVVYETTSDQFQWASLQRSGASIVIINLDEASADRFEALDELLADAERTVIFNDAKVTSALKGWDLARWARHLAAKVLGVKEVNPPRPAGAEAVPVRVNIVAGAKAAISFDDAVLGASPFPTPRSGHSVTRETALSNSERDLLRAASDVSVPTPEFSFENTPSEPTIGASAIAEDDAFSFSSSEVNAMFDSVPEAANPAVSKAAPAGGGLDAFAAEFNLDAGGDNAFNSAPQTSNSLQDDFSTSDSSLTEFGFAEDFLKDDGPAPSAVPEEDPFEAIARMEREREAAKLAVPSPTRSTAEKPAAPNERASSKVAMPKFDSLSLSLEPTDDAAAPAPAPSAPVKAAPAAESANPFDSILSKFSLEALDEGGAPASTPPASATPAKPAPAAKGLDAFTSSFALEPLADDLNDAPKVPSTPTATAPKPPTPPASVSAKSSLDDFAADFGLAPLDEELKPSPPVKVNEPAIAAFEESAFALEDSVAPTTKPSENSVGMGTSGGLDSFAADFGLELLGDEPSALDAPPKEQDSAFAPTKSTSTQASTKPASGLAMDLNDNAADDFAFDLDFDSIPSSDMGSSTIQKGSDSAALFEDAPVALDDWMSEFNQAASAIPGGHLIGSVADDGPVQRVWVLGASIGGPEAVREFLGALPASTGALFIYAQHMGADFYDLMVQQLERAVRLKVKRASEVIQAEYGEVLVAPLQDRVLVDAAGQVETRPLDEPSPYSPSIDQVLKDAADRFGSNANAIIFSGMAHDAIEGAIYLAKKGGRVWVQDPATCVVSSMIDGALEAGVVDYQGSPKELAAKLKAELGIG